MKTIYNVDYFIKKFEAIPENEMGTTQEGGCAYGQCRTRKEWGCQDGDETPEGLALEKLMIAIPNLTPSAGALFLPYENNGTPARINNGEVEQYQQPTPKQRILAALMDIKAKQDALKEWKQFRDSDIMVTRDGELKGRKISSGRYPRISYKHKTFRVHEIVYEAFNGAIPPHLEVNHKNGIKTDNRLDNLELCTHSDNMKHAFKTGLKKKPVGSKNPNWKGGIYKKGEYQKDWYRANKLGLTVIEYREKVIYKTVVIDSKVKELQEALNEN